VAPLVCLILRALALLDITVLRLYQPLLPIHTSLLTVTQKARAWPPQLPHSAHQATSALQARSRHRCAHLVNSQPERDKAPVNPVQPSTTAVSWAARRSAQQATIAQEPTPRWRVLLVLSVLSLGARRLQTALPARLVSRALLWPPRWLRYLVKPVSSVLEERHRRGQELRLRVEACVHQVNTVGLAQPLVLLVVLVNTVKTTQLVHQVQDVRLVTTVQRAQPSQTGYGARLGTTAVQELMHRSHAQSEPTLRVREPPAQRPVSPVHQGTAAWWQDWQVLTLPQQLRLTSVLQVTTAPLELARSIPLKQVPLAQSLDLWLCMFALLVTSAQQAAW
jgi:hypothetical protein